MFQRRYPSRSPSPPPVTEYSGFDQLYPLGSGGGGYHSKVPAAPPPPPPQSYPTGGGRQRGVTTATSMIISNLSDTVSKNDVAVSRQLFCARNFGCALIGMCVVGVV